MHVPVQLGGGIRDLDTIVAWLDKGVDRVILGTAAVRDPALVREAARDFPGCIAVGIDARDGKVAIEGWAETSEMTALDLARRFEDAGVAAIIYTDIARDGVLAGPQSRRDRCAGPRGRHPGDRERRACLASTTCSACSSRATRMLEGAIAGRALYDGRLDRARGARADRRERAASATADRACARAPSSSSCWS